MKKNLKAFAFLVVTVILIGTLFGCSNGGTDTSSVTSKSFDLSKSITVISREDGSGTRGAFIELMAIESKNADGTIKDLTTQEAIIANSTDLVLNQVAGNEYSIGYVSFGSLSDTVKSISVDGVAPTTDTITNGTFKISRPFIVATNGEATGLKKDFISFIMSNQGQNIVSKNKYIKNSGALTEYKTANLSGKLTIAGSTSVAPLMEKLIEEYKKLNSGVTIEMQGNGSSTGIKAALDNACDIAMSSRKLKDTEKLTPVTIATDGIVVVVNKNNSLSNISSANITKIFKGELMNWSDVK
jgi:phosphate transport system substrate-binding protein